MGFWHTGYEEFHEPVGLDDVVFTPSPPKRFYCEQCTKHFGDLDSLRRHRFESHPLRQPTLMVRGQSVGQLPLKVMMPLQSKDVEVEDALVCRFNGLSIDPAELGKRLASLRREFVEVELGNSGAMTRCALDFCVADVSDLKGVEAAFLRMARNRSLSIDAIAGFNQDCKSFMSAGMYAHGVSQYLYGVMAKERAPDSGIPIDLYTEKFLQANDVLSGFDRQLSNSIRALVAFHFNHFGDAQVLAPEGALRHTAAVFKGLLLGDPWHFEQMQITLGPVENLLTDQDTLYLLKVASLGQTQLKEHAQEIVSRYNRFPGGYDHLKRSLLATEALMLCGDQESMLQARQIARRWSSTADASAWAQAMLEKLGKS
jgi:hypothetical protein